MAFDEAQPDRVEARRAAPADTNSAPNAIERAIAPLSAESATSASSSPGTEAIVTPAKTAAARPKAANSVRLEAVPASHSATSIGPMSDGWDDAIAASAIEPTRNSPAGTHQERRRGAVDG